MVENILYCFVGTNRNSVDLIFGAYGSDLENSSNIRRQRSASGSHRETSTQDDGVLTVRTAQRLLLNRRQTKQLRPPPVRAPLIIIIVKTRPSETKQYEQFLQFFPVLSCRALRVVAHSENLHPRYITFWRRCLDNLEFVFFLEPSPRPEANYLFFYTVLTAPTYPLKTLAKYRITQFLIRINITVRQICT